MGKEALSEMAETLGKFSGLIVRELGSTGKQLVEGFKKGWRDALGEAAEAAEPAAAEKKDSG